MLSQDLIICLRQNQFFKDIDQKELEQLDECLFQSRHYCAGDVIIEEGTISDEMFLIVLGTVEILKKTSSGEQVQINHQYAGEYFGELSLIAEKKRSASVSCLTDVNLIVIKKEAFFSITANIPQLINNVAQFISERLRNSNDQFLMQVETNLRLLKLNQKINEQKKILESQKNELEALNATKDKFFSIISHDLKGPFTTLLGFSDLLLEDFERLSKAEIQKFVLYIHTSADNLFKLLDNLLQWSLAQTGRIEFHPESLDLYKIVKNTISLLIPNAEAKQIKLICNVPKQTMVCFDENMITTVFRNLISNAIKFSHPGGEIRVEKKCQAQFVELSVIDQGCGINQTDAEKLFLIDVKHSTKGTSGEAGTGLGLILCKEFINRHGGEIWVHSEPGKGSQFTFSLPQGPSSMPQC